MRLPALLFAMLLPLLAWGSERGRPLVQVYNTQELGGGHLNDSLIELSDGRLAVGNVGGLLLFDGARWRMFNHPKMLGGAKHLVHTADGRIYTAFNGDAGYFLDDGSGKFVWTSLAPRVSEEERAFAAEVNVIDDRARQGLWMVLLKRLYFVPDDGGTVTSIAAAGNFAFGALVGNDLWVQDTVAGLQRVSGMAPLQLEALPERDTLGAGQYLRKVVADGTEWKVAMANGRLYRYHDGRFLPWATELWPMLSTAQVFTLLRLHDGRFVIGAGEIGPLILAADGQLLERFDADDGLPRHATRGLLEDRDGGLWLAQDQTVVRIDLARGVTQFDETRGLASAYFATRWRGQLYVADGRGLFRLDATAGPGGGRFERVLPNLRNVRQLAAVDDQTLLVGSNSVHALSVDDSGTTQSELIFTSPQLFAMEPSRAVPGRVWVAHPQGLLRLDQTPAGEFEQTPVAGLTWPVYTLAEQDRDTLWVADRGGGLWRVAIGGDQAPKQYGTAQGVPEGIVRVYPGREGGVWFATMAGLRIYDAASDQLVAPVTLPSELTTGRLFSLLEDDEGNLWVRGDDLNDVALRQGDGYRWDGQMLNAVNTIHTVFGFLREEQIVWVLRANGMLRIDLAARRPLAPLPPPLVTSVTDLGLGETLHLAGLPQLPPTVRNLRLQFALPTGHRPEFNRYRSRLAGMDADWSPWSTDSSRDYTNLHDGAFAFDVEGMDSFARVSRMPAMTLNIAAPWWRTPMAYAGMLASALLCLWLAALSGARWRQRALLTRQRELEATVAARTLSLSEQNQQLADQSTQLQQQAERLRAVDALKTRFFTNVGHEFRTPLTLVLGPLDDVMRDSRIRLPERARELLELANRNAKRVLDLIVQLLDVNRLEHGQLPMQRERVELLAFLKRQRDDWQPLAERFGHQLDLELPDLATLELDCDPLQLERALGNLVSNAAKYTPRGGRIRVALSCSEDEVTLVVADNGQGIAAEALPHVFDRFFQAQAEHGPQGTGIGLALVREIVEGHDGQIKVDSTPGQGSCFTLTLPRTPITETVAFAVVPPTEAPEVAAAKERELPVALVIDDHTDLRLRLRRLLEPRFRVIEADDGPAGLAAARAELPDIIVCDVMMPGFDGVELAKRVRADADIAAVPLLLLTAKAGAEHAVTGLRAGADDYLSKPFDASELLARIDALLAVRRRLQRLSPTPAPAAATTPVVSDEDKFRARLDAAIKAHVGDSQFGVEELAQALHADRSTLFRRIKELYGQSARDYLREARLKHAFELLSSQAGNVTEVAYAAGFESLSSFSRAFRQRFGVSPSAAGTDAGRQAC